MSEASKKISQAQEELLAIAGGLDELNGRLAAVVEQMEPDQDLLSREILSGARCVSTDLLRDAIETLRVLGRQSVDAILERRAEIADSMERIFAFDGRPLP